MNRNRSLRRVVMVLAVTVLLGGVLSCEGTNVYVGVGVAGPYTGHGPYGYPYGGTVWVGRPVYP